MQWVHPGATKKSNVPMQPTQVVLRGSWEMSTPTSLLVTLDLSITRRQALHLLRSTDTETRSKEFALATKVGELNCYSYILSVMVSYQACPHEQHGSFYLA